MQTNFDVVCRVSRDGGAFPAQGVVDASCASATEAAIRLARVERDFAEMRNVTVAQALVTDAQIRQASFFEAGVMVETHRGLRALYTVELRERGTGAR